MSAAGNILPNPNTPMAYLPPEAAKAVAMQTYVTIGSLSVLIWDVLLHLHEDYKLATQHRINITFVIYCITRISSVAYMLGLSIYSTAPVGNCLSVIRGIHSIYPLTVPTTVLLFVFRVCALFNNNKFVVAFFSLSWLAVFASSLTLPIGAQAVAIGNTNYCALGPGKAFTRVVTFVPIVHETLVFIAISWAFMRRSYVDVNVKNGVKVMILGRHLPAFSKSVLHDGQAYYLSYQVFALVYNVLYYTNSNRIVVVLFGSPTLVLMTNMSCYVYRNVRLGLYREHLSRHGPLAGSIASSGEPRQVQSFKLVNTKTNFRVDLQTAKAELDDDNQGKFSRIEGNAVESRDLEGCPSTPTGSR